MSSFYIFVVVVLGLAEGLETVRLKTEREARVRERERDRQRPVKAEIK